MTLSLTETLFRDSIFKVSLRGTKCRSNPVARDCFASLAMTLIRTAMPYDVYLIPSILQTWLDDCCILLIISSGILNMFFLFFSLQNIAVWKNTFRRYPAILLQLFYLYQKMQPQLRLPKWLHHWKYLRTNLLPGPVSWKF